MEPDILISRSNGSATLRWTVIVLLVMAMAGGYMMVYALSPLQAWLQTSEGWSAMDYGRYSSAESFLNVFCGLLLVSGYLLDRFGARKCGIMSGLLMLVGGSVNYIALTPWFAGSEMALWLDGILNFPQGWANITPFCTGMPASAKMSAIGFMVFGVGVEMAGVAASRATVRWCMGKRLSLALGIQLAASRLAVAFAIWVSPRLADSGGVIDVSRPVGFFLLFLIIGLICWFAYGILDRRNENRPETNMENEEFHLRDLWRLLRSGRLWLCAGICFTYYSAVVPFYRYAGNMLQCSLGASASSAGDILSALPMVSALATPLVCLFASRWSRATVMIIAGTLLILVCQLIFAFRLPATGSAPLAWTAILMLGLSSALVAAGYWPLVPVLIPRNVLGSAYSWLYWVQNIGFWGLPLLVSHVLTSSNAGVTNPANYDYTGVMLVFASLSLGAFILSIWLRIAGNRHSWDKSFGVGSASITE